jgi:alkanesulfonate monooxygenase SsuD/methylene tetrahydromethanopterin reductase-like flavin-dependent oxidoreductase (luciferase family)
MNFGIFTDFHMRDGKSQADAFKEAFAQVDTAEALGIDSVWLAELHFQPKRSVLASPIVIASAIAARTQRLRMGIAVQVLPLGNPVRMAEEAATVDHISQGRFDFGVGRSGLTKFYQGYNIPYAESRDRFSEALDIILQAWTSEVFSYEGQYHSFHDVTVTPKPFQQPHPPVYIASASPESFAQAGIRGFPIFVSRQVNQLEQQLEQYRTAWHEAGHPGNGIVHLRTPVYVGETPGLARSQPKASTMQGLRYVAEELSLTAASEATAVQLRRLADMSYDEVLEKRVIYGSPEEVADQLGELKERLGLSGVVLETNYGGQTPQELVLNSIRLLSQEVMPRFR